MFPLLARKLVDVVKARKVYAAWSKPDRFDRNLIVIGAGAAGLVSAYIAAAVKAKVMLIEKHRMGGDCLNTGCVPSKALIRTAKLRDAFPVGCGVEFNGWKTCWNRGLPRRRTLRNLELRPAPVVSGGKRRVPVEVLGSAQRGSSRPTGGSS